MFSLRTPLIAVVTCLLFSGCNGKKKETENTGESPSTPPPAATPDSPAYRISGTVSGLLAGTLKIKLNDETLTLSGGTTSFHFPTPLPKGSAYSVSLLEQAPQPAMTCRLENATGTINGDVSDIAVKCPALQNIALSTSASTLHAGTAFSVKAVGLYEDGEARDLGALGLWSSDDVSIAAVNGRQVTAVASGSTNLRYVFGLKASLPITVRGGTLTSLTLTPTTVKMPLGVRQQLQLSGIYSDDTVQDLTESAAWSSSDVSVVQVGIDGKKGLIAGYSGGVAKVTAQIAALTAERTITVSAATLSGLDLQPAFISDAPGSAHALKATASFSDGTSWEVSGSSTWSSSVPSVATVSPSGEMKLIAPGQALVTATLAGLNDSLPVQVQEKTLLSLSLEENTVSLPVLAQRKLRALALYSDNTTVDVTDSAVWSSTTPDIATIGESGMDRGLARGQSAGTAKITATYAGKSVTGDLYVSAETPTALRLSPGETLLPKGIDLPFRLYGVYAGPVEHELTRSALWSSSNASVAEIDPVLGVLSNKYAGATTATVTVQAKIGSLSASAAVVVTPSQLSSIALTPTGVQLPTFRTVSLRAFGQFNDGGSVDLTDLVNWSSSAKSIASVSNAADAKGVMSTLTEGNALVTATLGSVTTTRAVTVSNSSLENAVEEGMGLRGQYYATKSFGSYKGSRIDGTVDFNWSTGNAPLGVGDNFSIRWTGFLKSAASGTHTFCTRSDDGVRLWIDGTLVINNWGDHSETENCATFSLNAGRKTPLQLEFYENGGYAVMRLFWTPPGGTKTIIPRAALFDR